MIAYTRDDSDAKSSTRRKVLKPQKVPQPATDVPIIDLVEHPKAYLSKLRSLQDTMNSVRTKTLERSSSLVKFLPIYEQTSLNREATILANWQVRQKEWERIQSDIGRRVNAPKVIRKMHIHFSKIFTSRQRNSVVIASSDSQKFRSQ